MKTSLLVILFLVALAPGISSAYGLTSIDNLRLLDAPAWFLGDDKGGFYGETESGLGFTQQNIATEYPVRIQKFTFGSEFFYVTDRGVIEARDDLAAVSIYFSLS